MGRLFIVTFQAAYFIHQKKTHKNVLQYFSIFKQGGNHEQNLQALAVRRTPNLVTHMKRQQEVGPSVQFLIQNFFFSSS